MMGIITLAGRTLAKEGVEFRYTGPADECMDCGLKAVCHKLTPGRKYRVVSVRDVEHACQVHDGDLVRVIEVEELPIEVSIPSRKALEAALIVLDQPDCPRKWCQNHILCTIPSGLKGKKVAIKEIGAIVDCPRDLKLKKAIVEPH